MKNLFKILVLFFGLNSAAQQGGNAVISTDAKILILGSDNQYTKHGSVANTLVMVEYQDLMYHGYRGYAFAGYSWVNLPKWYQSVFFGYGNSFKLSQNLDLIPSLEGGFIFRQPVTNEANRPPAGSWYVGANLDLRYYLNRRFALSLRPNVSLATDLPDRLLRFQATTGVVILNLWN